MVKFGSFAQVEFTLDEYRDRTRLLNKLNPQNIRRLDDETNIAAGLRLMRQNVFTKPGDRNTVKDIGLFTFKDIGLFFVCPAFTCRHSAMIASRPVG